LCRSFMDKSYASSLMGLNMDLLGPRFPSMGGDECNPELANYFKEAAKELNIDLHEGVYAMLPGPRYEFSGEWGMLRKLGIDATGMSTVPEVVAALHGYFSEEEYDNTIKKLKKQGKTIPAEVDFNMARRIKVAAVSCITNVITADGKNQTNHEEVQANSEKAASKFVPLVKSVASKILQKIDD